MNLPDKIKNSNSYECCMSEEAKAINQLIDYLKEKDDISQSTNSDIQAKSIQQKVSKK